MAGSLREALESAVAEHDTTAETPQEATAPIDKIDAETITQSEAVGEKNNAAAFAADKEKSDGRARDDQGRFTEQAKEAKQPVAKAPVVAAASPAQQAQAPVTQGQPPAVEAGKYPTTWKKGLEAQWAALPPEVKAEVMRREGNYASGVSTYKQEWDRAKPLIDVIAPYQQILQQHNIKPDAHVATLLKTHHDIVTGTPQQKATIMMNIMRGNGIDPAHLFVQGEDGKVYFNPNLAQAAPQQQAPQQQFSRDDAKKMVAEEMSVAKSNQEIESFLSQTDKYPHAKEVAATMAQLLEANLADDLPGAYQQALRMTQHSHLYEADQKQASAAAEKAAADAKRKTAEAARRNAVSVRSSTPTSVSSAAGGKKSLRDTIAENVDGVASGRV